MTVELTEKPSPATFVVVSNVVEVGPNSTKEFPVRFVSYVEGTTKGVITFTNPETGEYVFYALKVTTTAADVLETIEIESPIRQTARYVMSIENPLPRDVPVSMGTLAKPDEWWTCESKFIRVVELIPMNGNSEGSFEIEYRPLLLADKSQGSKLAIPNPDPNPEGCLILTLDYHHNLHSALCNVCLNRQPSTHFILFVLPTVTNQSPTNPILSPEFDLSIISRDLGVFKYKLRLTTSPPALRQTLRFEIPLGAIQVESFIFRTYLLTKTDFTCGMRSSSEGGGKKGEGGISMFQVPKTLSVNAAPGWEGEDVRLAVTFEPTEIGTVRDVLTVSSPVGGEYVCDLIATCIPPLPQGPFNFTKGGGAVDIPFRNCFASSCNWSYSVDSTAFKVSASTGSVAAKTEGKCSVVFDPQGTCHKSWL